MNSGLRVLDQTLLDGDISRKFDSEEWYNQTRTAIDRVGTVTAFSGAGGTLNTLKLIKADLLNYGNEAAKKSLKKLSTKEKLEISKEILGAKKTLN